MYKHYMVFKEAQENSTAICLINNGYFFFIVGETK